MLGVGQKSLLRASGLGVAAAVGLAPCAMAFEARPFQAPAPSDDFMFAPVDNVVPSDLAAAAFGPVKVDHRTATVRASGGSVDRVSLTTLSLPATALASPGARYRDAGYELSLVRDWPNALALNAGAYDLSVSPHAGLGLSSYGARPEAGATVSIGKADRAAEKLSAMGVRDGKAFGDQSRWYMFAAVSGKSVGLNMTQSGEGGWQGAGWSQDAASSLVGDGQLGVGYRRGAMQAAFGYVHREIKVQNAPHGADNDVTDSMAAFTLSFRPHR